MIGRRADQDGNVRLATRAQDAVRLLFLMFRAGTEPPVDAPPDAVKVIQGQMRLQALDFWLRNPDYVASEIVDEVDSAQRPHADLSIAEEILDSDEPDIRRFPMVRYLFGAYEPLDDALALLRSAALIAIHRHEGGRSGVWRHDYYLLKAGQESAERLLCEAPELIWYAQRAELVAELARDTGGAELKRRQYEQIEYSGTELGTRISPIADRVRAKLLAMRVT